MILDQYFGEGLGRPITGLEFTVTSVEGDIVHTNAVPEKFNRTKYAPFDYQLGQKFWRDIWETGEFVESLETGEAYFIPRNGTPLKVEGDLNRFIAEMQERGKQNKFERLLREGKITPMVRTRAYSGKVAILEIALAEDSDANWYGPSNPLEAYVLLVDLINKSALIVSAKYNGAGSGFLENISEADRAFLKFVPFPKGIVEVAQPHDIIHSQDLKPLDKALIPFIRENSYKRV